MRVTKLFLAALAAGMICGCVSVMSLERQATIDGLVLYGFVNVAPSAEITKDRMRSDLAKASCALYPDDWCRQQEDFEFVSLMLMNTYAGGLRGVGTFVPLSEKVAKGDIVVIRSRQRGTAEFLRVASRGERDDCGWVGGGITRALTAAGVVCENYDWKQFAPLFYD